MLDSFKRLWNDIPPIFKEQRDTVVLDNLTKDQISAVMSLKHGEPLRIQTITGMSYKVVRNPIDETLE